MPQATVTPLQVFESHARIPFVYRVKGSWQPVAVVAKEKRFTDAEMAAEYWASCFDHLDLYGAAGNHPETRVLERFANTPHYDHMEG